jgi:hypothetical protein
MNTAGTAVIGNMARTAMPPIAYHWVVGAPAVTYIVPLAGETESWVGALSGDGLRVLGLSGARPFQWFTTEVLNAFAPRTGENLTFYDSDADGGIAVGDGPTSGANRRGFVLDLSITGTINVGGTGIDSSSLYGVSADGLTAVGSMTTGGMAFAAVWTSAAGLTALPSAGGSASDISDDARFIVGGVDGRATRWSGATYQTVTSLPIIAGTTASSARDVSADGSVVVGWSAGSAAASGALVWTDGRVQRVEDVLAAAGVNLTGWVLRSANHVSGDGNVIAGDAIAPDGQTTGFIARLR